MDRENSSRGEGQPLLSSASLATAATETDSLIEIRPNQIYHSPSSASFTSDSSNHFTSCPAAIFLTVNACLGAGLLNFPHAFQSAGGLTTALIAQAVLLILITGALFILSYCTQFSDKDTFQDLVEYFTGRSIYKSLISIAIILYSFGSCLAFIIIVGDQIDRVLSSQIGPDFCYKWYLSRGFTMSLISTCTILPLSFSRSIDFLKYPSSLGVLVIIYLIFLSCYEWIKKGSLMALALTSEPNDSELIDVMRVVPVICFGYQCHISWVPTYSMMREQATSRNLAWTIIISMAFCAIAYTSVAIFAVLAFGESLFPDLMLNYDARDVPVMIGITIVAFKTITTYPMLLYCARLAIDDFIVSRLRIIRPERSELRRRIIIVVLWFASSVSLAIVVPDIAAVIRIVGTLAILFIFIIPGVCLISLTEKLPYGEISGARYFWLNLIGTIYCLVGAFIFGVSITQSIEYLIEKTNPSYGPPESYCKTDLI